MLCRYIRLRSKLEAVSNSCESTLTIAEFVILERARRSEAPSPIERPELITDGPKLLANLEREQVMEPCVETRFQTM
jgi:hypothetical protein